MSLHSSQSQQQRQQFNNHQDQDREIPDSAEEDNNEPVMDSLDLEQLDGPNEVPGAYYEDSDYSAESEEEVDPAVQEDMDKFQETFKGIKERFRLINRIGEGKLLSLTSQHCHYSNILQAHFPPCTKPRTSATTNTITTGTSKRKSALSAVAGPHQAVMAYLCNAVAAQGS